MVGYYIAEIEVHDDDAYVEYRELASAAIQAHGGEIVVRGGEWESLEGAELVPLPGIRRSPRHTDPGGNVAKFHCGGGMMPSLDG